MTWIGKKNKATVYTSIMTEQLQDAIAQRRLHFTDNPAVTARRQEYQDMHMAIADILASWRQSLLAHEWLDNDGVVRARDALSQRHRRQREHIEKLLADQQPLPTPVLGIGMFENIEIGAGRDVVLTLAAHGIEMIPVHVPLAHIEDFRALEP